MSRRTTIPRYKLRCRWYDRGTPVSFHMPSQAIDCEGRPTSSGSLADRPSLQRRRGDTLWEEPVGMLIRFARFSDLHSVCAIYNDAVRTGVATFDHAPRSLATQQKLFTNRDRRHAMVVADDCGTVCGWASLGPFSHRHGYAHTAEFSFYVDRDYQRRRIGTHLADAILHVAHSNDLHTILALIEETNVASLRICHRLGFETVGRLHEVGHKFGRWLNVQIVQKSWD